MTVNQCIEKLKEAHRDLYPIWWIEDQGVYMFALLQRGIPKDEAAINFYAVDPEKGTIAGPIPPTMVYGNDELTAKLENPHKVTGEDQRAVSHDAMRFSDFLAHYGVSGMQWGVRRYVDENGRLTAEGRRRYGYNASVEDVKAAVAKEKQQRAAQNGSTARKQAATTIPSTASTVPKGVVRVSSSKPAKPTNAQELLNSPQPKEKMSLADKIRTNQAKAGIKMLEGLDQELPDNFKREETKKGGVDKGEIISTTIMTVINPLNAVYLAADAGMAVSAKRKTEKYMKEREEKSELDSKTGLYKKKEGAYSEKEDLAAVNPGFRNMNTNSKNNCMLCTTTYEMRKRGFDVTAQLDSVGYSFPDLKRWFPKAKIEKNTRFDENGKAMKQKDYVEKTLNSLVKQGDGARGNLIVCFKEGGAHSIFYEVQNGKVMFLDGQSNTVYGGKNSLTSVSPKPEKLLNMSLSNAYARLDNVQPDMKRIKAECVR